MRLKAKQIRKVILGIRFKFSFIIILSVALSSTLLIFALINQHEKKMTEALARQGETILKGISDQAVVYLRSRRLLSSDLTKSPGKPPAYFLAAQRDHARKAMSLYFASVVGQETKKGEGRMLDIAFIVDIDWSKKGAYRSIFQYFHRQTGALFIHKGGRNDPLLEPTALRHFTNTINTGAYLGFATISDVSEQYHYLFKDNPDYVIVAVPIFHEKTKLYDDYITFRNETVSQSTAALYLKNKREFPVRFISRILSFESMVDYQIDLSYPAHSGILLNFFLGKSLAPAMMPSDMLSMKKEFETLITHGMQKGFISISRVESIWRSIQKKYRIPFRTIQREPEIRKECLTRLLRHGVPITSSMPLDELALISFRNDLAGVLGLFFYRKEYFPEMLKSAHEIINLSVSIILRVAFLALLFPAFIIKSIRTLEDGAIEIGKGKFDKIIDISGSDEIGRLADIFNLMTANLKKAEQMRIEKIRMENELLTACEIQSALLPEKIPEIKGIEFGAYYLAQTESGGDYYDVINLGDNKLGIAIADVSGHGVGSGLVMAMTRTLLHTCCKNTGNTKKVFEVINEYLKHNTASNYFVTMFYGILDLNSLRMTYSSAGHSPAMILRNGKIRELQAGGIALGASSPETFAGLTDVMEVHLQNNDYFVLYTDGVDESMDADGKEYGLERFQKALLLNEGRSPRAVINAVMADIRAFTGDTPQHDDITMILFRINR